MVTPELADYIQQQISAGVDKESIRHSLLEVGWQESDISAALVSPRFAWITALKIFFIDHKKLAIGIPVAALLLIGTASFAAYKFIPPSPEKMLSLAGKNMDKATSFDFSGKVTVEVSSSGDFFSLKKFLPDQGISDPRIAGSADVNFGIDFTGSVDATVDSEPKADVKVSMSSSVFSVGVNLRVVNNIIYFKLDQIPEIAEGFQEYADTWLKVDPTEITKQFGVNIDLENGKPNLTDGQKKQIEALSANLHAFSSVKRLSDDSIDGQGMYHYSAVLDMKVMKDYLAEIYRIETSAGGFGSFSSDSFDNFEVNNLEFWIDKSNKMIGRVSGQVAAKPVSGQNMPSGAANFLVNFSNFDHPTEITEPTEYKDLVEVIKLAMGDANIKARDARRLSDIQYLRTGLELYFVDVGYYPVSLDKLKDPLYVSNIPVAPTPSDGTCTADDNVYTYQSQKSGQSYALNFCLGTDFGGPGAYTAGKHTADPDGIK